MFVNRSSGTVMTFKGALTSKLPTVGTTIFSVMSKLAQEAGAINLSQGFPDFNCPSELMEKVDYYMRQGNNQYAPMPGVIRLREAIAKKTFELYGNEFHPESEITITAGATQGIYAAIASVIKEGDEVIVFEPAYDCYVPAIELNGGKAVFAQLSFPDYRIKWDEVKKLIKQKTRMMIINTPNNPSGMVMTKEDMVALDKLTRDTDIIILSDEVYEHIVFDDQKHESVARYPKLAERSFIVSSFGKTYHTTGWKLGYVIAPENLTTEFRKAHQYIVFSVNTPAQLAYADFLEHKEHYLGLSEFYQQKRDYFLSLIKGSALKPLNCSGTYFQLLSYENISTALDKDFAVELTQKHKIASIPVSVFYHKPQDHKVLRFCFAKSVETLEKAAAILCSI